MQIMVKKYRYTPRPIYKSRKHDYYFLAHEKKELEKHYDFVTCRIVGTNCNRKLEVFGYYKQTGKYYKYKIEYDGYSDPIVSILSPNLVEEPPHVYAPNNNLCLYYPKDQPWLSGKCSLYEHIIPWVHEWILFYEIWLLSGKWEHPEVLHNVKQKFT